MDLEDGIQRRFHGSADEFSRPPPECGAWSGHEDGRHAAASAGLPPEHEQRSPVPAGRFIALSVNLLQRIEGCSK